MGFAIKRPDGTYRAWNANTKDDALAPGETWEELAQQPELGQAKGPLPDHRLVARGDTRTLAERAQTLALLHFINEERAARGAVDLKEDDVTAKMDEYTNRL